MAIDAYKYPSSNYTKLGNFSIEDSPLRISRASLLTDTELGGVNLNDSSQGLMVKQWTAKIINSDVVIYPTNSPGEQQTLFSYADISECALTFDYNMQPLIAFMALGTMYLRWYDVTRGGYVIDSFSAGDHSPVLSLDDKRMDQTAVSDVFLFYIRGSNIYARVLRDRFTIEYVYKSNITPTPKRIVRCGLSNEYRFQLQYI